MPTIGDLTGDFARARRGEGRKEAGVERYVQALGRFGRWLAQQGVADVAAIDHLVVMDYRDYMANDRQNTPATVQNALTCIRAFARWARKRGYMTGDPTDPDEVRWPQRRRPAPKPLQPAELAALVAILDAEPAADDAAIWRHRRNRLACHLMYYAGLRLGEAARLQVRDVNLVAATVTIRQSKGRDRSVALHPALLITLAGWLAGRRQTDPVIPNPSGQAMGPAVLAKIFERWLPERGLAISAHRLRHSFGTELLRACGNLRIVQVAMGHASSETTEQYTLVVVEDQRPAIGRIPELGSFGTPH